MINIQYSLIAIVLLLAANAFFVAAEFALVKVRRYQLEQESTGARPVVGLSLRMHRKMDRYLAACQLGITMASLGLGWVGEPAVAAILEPLFSRVGITGPSLHTVAFLVGFLLFSSLHIVIGEQVPKTFAIRKPTPVTLALAYPLHWFYLLVYPLNWLLDRANSACLRLLGVRDAPHHEVISEDEISAIVDDSEAHGELEQKTAEIIRNAFRFDDQLVREVMVPWNNVDKLYLDAAPEINEGVVLDTLHSRFPVLDSAGDVVGLLATKDLTSALLKKNDAAWDSLKRNLRPPLIVPETLLISLLLERMRATRTHMAIVVDEHGNYLGIVTLEDMLEEIIGEIADEWDSEDITAPIEAVDSAWKAIGQLPLSIVEETTEIGFENTPKVTTLGGFVMSRLGRLPKQGDRFSEAGYEYQVTKMEGRRIETVMISPTRKSKSKTSDSS